MPRAEELVSDYDEEGFADDPEKLHAMIQMRLQDSIPAFKDPILQYQYERLLENEDELLSLDAMIAAAKVRFGIAVRRGEHTEVAHLMRSLTDAVQKAIDVREKHREYVHLEQMLWLLQEVYNMQSEVVSNQDEVHELQKRLSKLVLIPREDVPLELRKTARALAEGRKQVEKVKR